MLGRGKVASVYCTGDCKKRMDWKMREVVV